MTRLAPRLSLFCLAALAPAAAQEPTLSGVRYGPHERHVLDLWKADSTRPAPVLIFFHGGSFKGGDKGMFRERAGEFLRAGISAVSANYRFSRDAIYPGPMLDGARVVQFVRSRAAAWNIDPSRIAVSGGSAGGTMALWIALHDDLADAASQDPVARLSTRVACATVRNAPTSMDPEFIRRHLGATNLGGMLDLHGARSREELLAGDKRRQALDASPLEHATGDDPPLMLAYGGELTPTPLPEDTRFGAWIHHPRFGELLKRKCDALGLECEFYHRGRPAPAGAEIAFLRRCFSRATGAPRR